MFNIVITLGYLILVAVGSYVGFVVVLMALSVPVAVYRMLAKAAGYSGKYSAVTLASVPSTIASETVPEFIRGISDMSKRAAYADIWDKAARLKLDVTKHRDMYPKNLQQFMKLQLDFFVSESAVSGSLETAKFKKLVVEQWDAEGLWT